VAYDRAGLRPTADETWIRSPSAASRISPALGAALLALGLILLGWGCLRLRELQADDAYITFRYARNLYEGQGAVFNPGERVEGYSNPLWMLAIALGFAGGLEPIWLARIISIASAALLLAGLYRSLLAASVPEWGAALAAILLSGSVFVHMAAMAGLETITYALFFFGGIALIATPDPTPRKALGSSTLLALAALTRPEGIAYWGAGLIFVAIALRGAIAAYCAPGLVLVAHLVWRWSYYGDLLPNTWYVKASTRALWGLGFEELASFIAKPHVLALALLAALGAATSWRMRRRRRAIAWFGGTTLFHLGYVVSVGGDGIGMNRFQVPVLPSLALLAGLGFAAPLPRSRARAIAAVGVLGVALATAVSLLEAPPSVRVGWRKHMERLGRQLAATRAPDTLIAVAAAGAIPYYSRLPALDLLGLTDRVIARSAPTDQPSRAAAGHMKWNIDYVLSRKPDLIINDAFVANENAAEVAKEPLILARGPMWKELYGKFLWNEDYTHHAIDLGDGYSAFVFERRPREAPAPRAPAQSDEGFALPPR
jgi:arabinofuranosyltransferase